MHAYNDDTTHINIFKIVTMTQSSQKHTFFSYNRQNADNIPDIIIVRYYRYNHQTGVRAPEGGAAADRVAIITL